MKKTIILVVSLVYMAFTFTISAQNPFDDATMTSSIEYKRFDVAFDQLIPDEDGDADAWNGFALEYLMGKPISTAIPLYYETGIRGQFNWFSDVYSGSIDYTQSFGAVSVPFNVLYKIAIPGSSLYLIPYAGIYGRYNLYGKLKMEYNHESETISFFDKDDMGGRDETWGRFQVGYQIGANLQLPSSWVLGFQYQCDFNEIYGDSKLTHLMFSVGVCF